MGNVSKTQSRVTLKKVIEYSAGYFEIIIEYLPGYFYCSDTCFIPLRRKLSEIYGLENVPLKYHFLSASH